MIWLYIVSLIIFISYSIIILNLFGVLQSVSASYYSLKKYGDLGVFTMFCWGVAFPLLIYWIEFSQSDWNFLPFLACSGLMFVGASPAFRDLEFEEKVHTISALICLICSYLWALLFGNFYLALGCMLFSLVLYFISRKNRIYWIEMIAFMNIYVQLLWI